MYHRAAARPTALQEQCCTNCNSQDCPLSMLRQSVQTSHNTPMLNGATDFDRLDTEKELCYTWNWVPYIGDSLPIAEAGAMATGLPTRILLFGGYGEPGQTERRHSNRTNIIEGQCTIRLYPVSYLACNHIFQFLPTSPLPRSPTSNGAKSSVHKRCSRLREDNRNTSTTVGWAQVYYYNTGGVAMVYKYLCA